MTLDPGGPLSDAELRDLVRLLARFAEHELDQFANRLLPTTYGPVYLAMTRSLWPGSPVEAFDPVWPPPSPPGSNAP
ncbi:hypothetical protein [Actinoplanes sp. NPDC026623]|uniref:hypothetical protein n=1 Tax=Actinoplanes sp. NPDC026623 TaxID=3155610 RepID=UPI0033CBC384